MKLARLIRMCLNQTQSRIGKTLSDTFSIQNCLKQGDALSSLLLNFGLKYAIWKVQNKSGRTGTEWNISIHGRRRHHHHHHHHRRRRRHVLLLLFLRRLSRIKRSDLCRLKIKSETMNPLDIQ